MEKSCKKIPKYMYDLNQLSSVGTDLFAIFPVETLSLQQFNQNDLTDTLHFRKCRM